MPIPIQYRPLIDRVLDRSRKGTGKWNESARLEEAFQIADGHALLIRRTDPTEEPIGISVEILNRMGELVFSELFQPGDPDFATLSELSDLAKRSLEQTPEPTT